jgi:Ca-activated chloride channel family protein
MTLDPMLPVWAIALLASALVGFCVWQLVVAPRGAAAQRSPRLAWALRVSAVLLLAVVAVRPVIPAPPAVPPTTSGGLEVYIAVDTTSSMAAEDWNGDSPRLDGVEADIAAMADRLQGASFSLITFDAEAVQRVPLTSDATALVSAGDVLTQEITVYSRGSSIDEPVDLLTEVIGTAADANPAQERVLFYLGDGEQTADVAPGSFAELAPLISGGAVLGYGTDGGGPMLSFTGYDDPNVPAEYIQDYSSGEPVQAVSTIDEANLGTIADQLGVEYTHRDAGSSIAGVLDGFDIGDVTVSESTVGAPVELYWIAAALLGVFAIAELLGLGGALVELRRALRPSSSSDAGARP